MKSKGGTNFALKTNFPKTKKKTKKKLTIIYVATEIMTVLTKNLPK